MRSLYDNENLVHLPPQSVPLSQTLSEEAIRWLTQLYVSAYSYESGNSDNQPSARVLLKHVEFVKSQLKDEQDHVTKENDISIETQEIENILVDIVTPRELESHKNRNRLIIYFNDTEILLGQGMMSAAIYMASEFKIRVAIPRLQLSYGQSLRNQLNSLFAVYSNFSRSIPAENIALVGESKGASICASLVVLAYQQEVKCPGGLALVGIEGIVGDSNHQNYYLNATNLADITSICINKKKGRSDNAIDTEDPVLCPFNANMKLFPSTILFAGTRDINFSATIVFHRELKRAGNRAKLYAFDGLPQMYHHKISLPETRETFGVMFSFLDSVLAT